MELIGNIIIAIKSLGFKDMDVIGYDSLGYQFETVRKNIWTLPIGGKEILLRKGLLEGTVTLKVSADKLLDIIETAKKEKKKILAVSFDIGGATQRVVIHKKFYDKLISQLKAAKERSIEIEKEANEAFKNGESYILPPMRA